MIAFDLPPPAIIQARLVVPFALHVNREDAARLPDDLMAMPMPLRALVKPSEVRPYLPAEYRRLPTGLIVSLLGNIGGLPGVVMAGGVKTAYLYTASGTFDTPGDWNKNDNALHAIGRGGNGAQAVSYTFIGGTAGGGGGGGAAWARIDNHALAPRSTHTVTVAVSSGSTWFSATDQLLATSGANANGEIAGAGGSSGSSVGDQKNSGGNGEAGQGASASNRRGGYGGGAGGPDGAGGTPGTNGSVGTVDLDEKVPGVGPGGGGQFGFSDPLPGVVGYPYGGGGGGGGGQYSPLILQPGGAGEQGVLLIINNLSL